ncbi:uncharacterized protein LOC123886134 [Trifolium pratense]|uniref:uncharacterized protein LOC123886134 n=1 Tax=Trifolium pratense TaxID=57577 RepID=UPI001E69257B|nr:uncharacterized protein LOC123886134 [Trifolium pratense]
MSKERYIPEGGSASRPPLFTGKNYYFWKNKMQLFLKSQEVGMWRIVTEGDYVPTVTSAEGVISDKPEDAWTTAEQQKVLLNSKAHLFLSCALSMEESERVDECDTAKKVWDTLQVHHEGTSHVKETRIDIGTNKFETFEMIENETIDEMFSRFTTIINELRSLGKTFSTNDRIRKLLRCLPVTWRPMVTAITQTKDLKTLPIEDLIGTLKAHEVILQGDKPLKKEKTIALKASQKDISFLEDDSKELESTQEEAEGELALISGKIQHLIESKEKHVCSSVLSKKIDENVVLKNEIMELRNDLTGFIKSTETFQNIMGSQSQALNKNDLGFNEVKNKIFENVLLPANRELKLRCSFCNKNGHKIKAWFVLLPGRPEVSSLRR